MASKKLAITLPSDLFEELERVRKQRGLGRSAVIQSGVRAWLRSQREREKVRRYVEAYRAFPESEDEIAEAARLVEATWMDRDSG